MPKLHSAIITGSRGGGTSYIVNLQGEDACNFRRNVLGETVDLPKGKPGARTYIDDDFYYMPVVSTDRIAYQGTVYNLEVEENHCYCAPFVVHNSEGFGLEVIEALSYGRSVLASTTCGASDHVLVSRRFAYWDVGMLAAMIDMERKDTEGGVDMRRYWRMSVKDLHWPKIEQRYATLWRSLLEGKSDGHPV